jgi:hypothetical protein
MRWMGTASAPANISGVTPRNLGFWSVSYVADMGVGLERLKKADQSMEIGTRPVNPWVGRARRTCVGSEK